WCSSGCPPGPVARGLGALCDVESPVSSGGACDGGDGDAEASCCPVAVLAGVDEGEPFVEVDWLLGESDAGRAGCGVVDGLVVPREGAGPGLLGCAAPGFRRGADGHAEGVVGGADG